MDGEERVMPQRLAAEVRAEDYFSGHGLRQRVGGAVWITNEPGWVLGERRNIGAVRMSMTSPASFSSIASSFDTGPECWTTDPNFHCHLPLTKLQN
jgi:hypothetical protein